MFCRCRERLRRRAEHADVPGVPRVSRCAAGAEPARDRGDDQARPRARLHDRRARGLPPQELLLSRPAEGVPDQPVRRAALRGRQARRPDRRRRRDDRDRRGRTSRRTPRRTCTSRRRAASTARPRRSSTSTAAARRCVEIVTEPDLHDAETAKRFLQLLRQTVVELELSDAELEKGSMRFDVNVSVRPAGSDELRTRTELKNMNSFNFAAKGIEREIARQIRIYEAGGEVSRRRCISTRRRGVAAAALQGGGAGLSLLPGARPRAGAAARRARRARCAARSASCPARGSAASPTRCRSTTPTCS